MSPSFVFCFVILLSKCLLSHTNVILRFYFSLYYFNSFLCYFNSFLYWSTPVHVLTIRGVNFLNCKFDYFTAKFQITFLSKDIYSATCIKISCLFVCFSSAHYLGFFGGKKSTRLCRRCGFDSWVEKKSPGEKNGKPIPVFFLHGESHRQKSVVDYS